MFSSSAFSSAASQAQDVAFNFYVTLTDPGTEQLDNRTLTMSGSASGDARATISETILTANLATTLATPSLTLEGQNTQLSDQSSFLNNATATNIFVQKDIAVVGGVDTGGSAQVTSFTQIFSEEPVTPTPEPSTLALFAVAALGWAGHAWRRRRGS